MDYISVKHSLKKEQFIQTVVAKVLDKVKAEIVINPNDKFNMELLTFIATIIENLVDNKGKNDKKKINKLVIAHEVYGKLFTGISKTELDTLSNNIEYLIDRGAIKTYSFLKRIWKNLKVWLEKKAL
jgi:hypothetical protein